MRAMFLFFSSISPYVSHLLPSPCANPKHGLPRNLLACVRVKLAVIPLTQPMHTLQHPSNTLLRQEHSPIATHSRLNPTRIHADHHRLRQLLPHMPALLHRKRIQRRLRDRVRRAPPRVDRKRETHRCQSRRHIDNPRRARQQLRFQQELRRLGRADDVDADVLVEVRLVDGERGLIGDGVDAGVVDQEVDFGAIENFACFGDERADGILGTGVTGEDVSGGGGDRFEISEVGGGGADTGDDGICV